MRASNDIAATPSLLSLRHAKLWLGILSDPVAKRPVFFLDFDQIDQDIFCPNIKHRMEPLRDLQVEDLLCLESASLIQSDLDHEKAVGALDIQIGGIVDQTVVIMLGNDLKMVLCGNSDGAAHDLIDDLSNFFAKLRRFSLH